MFTFHQKNAKKSRYLCNSMTDLHKIWQDDAEHVSHVKKFNFRNPRWRTTDTLRKPILHQRWPIVEIRWSFWCAGKQYNITVGNLENTVNFRQIYSVILLAVQTVVLRRDWSAGNCWKLHLLRASSNAMFSYCIVAADKTSTVIQRRAVPLQ